MKPFAQHVLAPDFDPGGLHLVEASAGTGKTYSIQTLYLRLALAHGIAVQRLLVVTFTEAATKELRERLRAILEKCRRCLEGEGTAPLPPDDPDRERIARILALPLHRGDDIEAGMSDEALRAGRIRRALLDFDQAAVFTIHGFCQRALQEFAFECGHEFDAEVIDGKALLRELCADWWRRVQHGGTRDLADAAARAVFPGVDRLTAAMEALLKRPYARLLPESDPRAQSEAAEALRAACARAVATAREYGSRIGPELEAGMGSRIFAPGRRERIARDWARLRDEDADEAERLRLLLACGTALEPEPIANPHQRLPPAVAECVAACAACLEMAARHKIEPGGGGAAWSAPEQARGPWREALARAVQATQAHRPALERFFAEVVAAEAACFVKTELISPDKLRKRLDALRDGQKPREMLTALKRLAEVRVKSTRISWSAGAAGGQMMAAAKDARAAVARLGLLRQAAGMRETAELFERRKREARGMTYDDMLARLWRALRDESAALHPLRDALRRKYAAALIDEFQDTDPVQYRIFETLFADGAAPLFFVGDPKQAIYAFRGGDIHTYCAAKRMVAPARRCSLDTNYRSRAPLIAALNDLFRDRDGATLFGSPEIRYERDLKCNDLASRLVEDGVPDERPFKIWDFRFPEERRQQAAGIGSGRARQVYEAVAEEIVRLLAGERTGFAAQGRSGGVGAWRRLRPSDIAILVRRHREAALLHRALRRRGVPARRQAGDNVFDAPEAAAMLYLLRALCAPRRGAAVKTALASRLLPVSDTELAALARDETVVPAAAADGAGDGLPARLDEWLELFDEAAALWRRGGFAPAWERLAGRTGMRAWLASREGGERSLANVIQLQDLLHGVAGERRLGPEALLAWHERQLDAATREVDDAFETRLESDADAVRIMTIFKSKGLEFPIVFVPTMWSEIPGGRKAVCRVYHAADGQDGAGARKAAAESGAPAPLPEVLLNLDMDDGDAREAEAAERLEEDMRNLYVAVTRASHRTYLVAGDFGAGKVALASCLPRAEIERRQAVAAGAIEVRSTGGHPPAFNRLPPRQAVAPEELRAEAPPRIDKTRGHASFSALAPAAAGGAGGDLEGYDFDAADAPREELAEVKAGTIDAFSFPAGARTGECWHRIFELLDFGADDGAIEAVAAAQLALFRLDQGDEAERRARRAVTVNMVRSVLRAELRAGGRTLRLADVRPECKRHEMAFDFALRAEKAAGAEGGNALWRTLRDAWRDREGDEALFRERLRDWRRAIPGGYMTGFIDLFFEHEGRYYIVDWKSNRLDGCPESFERDRGLAAEMARHAYFLQYLIYTVVADGLLRESLGAEYDYERDFGGVFYLFLRAIGTGGAGSQRGIYYTRPEAALVAQLARALMARPARGGQA